MNARKPVNIAASVHDRLLNRSRETGENFQFILQRYAAERFLYRLGETPYRDRFVLKGAMLFVLWGGTIYRSTRDLDFAVYGSKETEDILEALRKICIVSVADDGLALDAGTLNAELIRDHTEYKGLRIRFVAMLGNARIPMQIDIGFGNAIEPPAVETNYPTLLAFPAPRILAYPHEAVVAEKFHAMVELGEPNSRYKDFYDLYVLAFQFPFDGGRLSRAIGATFKRRRTPIGITLPAVLTPRFFADGARAKQWLAYLSRNTLPSAPADFASVGDMIQSFIRPIWDALANKESFSLYWPKSGPWGVIK
jgi:predicted nucleotidyltransferase component of viral defense system